MDGIEGSRCGWGRDVVIWGYRGWGWCGIVIQVKIYVISIN